MTREEAIQYLQPIADSAHMKRYSEALGVAIAALREQEPVTNRNGLNGWISVEDRLPEEYVRVLVMVPEANKLIGSPDMDTDRVAKDRWVRWDRYVTHWMPLPEPPEVEA